MGIKNKKISKINQSEGFLKKNQSSSISLFSGSKNGNAITSCESQNKITNIT